MKKQLSCVREKCCPGKLQSAVCAAFQSNSPNHNKIRNLSRLTLLLSFAVFLPILPSSATVTAVSVQSPDLSAQTTLTTPIHFQATAESTGNVTGYVVYVDGQNVYQNYVPFLDSWVILKPGSHSLYVKAWDSTGASLATQTYSIEVSGAGVPQPPVGATRIVELDAQSNWVVDNNPNVGGLCNNGSIGQFQNASDPNTNNAPDFDSTGKHFMVQSKCQYDDSLFYNEGNEPSYAGVTNYLWDYWVYMPTTTKSSYVQALEFDMFQAVKMNDGVHEFMFGTECVYGTNQWQNWLPENGGLHWVNVGISPCQLSTGMWHHITYFFQRVTSSGYQIIPATFGPTTDNNKSLRFGTLTVDGQSVYLGGQSYSTIPSPPWGATLGVQHQLDSAVSGVTIQQFADNESLTIW
jgi:hypothetical protein